MEKRMLTRIILDAGGDLFDQAHAAKHMLDHDGPLPRHSGVRINGLFYGIQISGNALRVFPEEKALPIQKEHPDV